MITSNQALFQTRIVMREFETQDGNR